LSVSGSCPECSLPIRATLLAVVDPHATEFQPITAPRLTAVGLALLAIASFAAALAAWGVRLHDVAVLLDVQAPAFGKLNDLLPGFAVGCTIAAAIGAIVLIKPHAKLAGWSMLGAAVSCVCIGAIALITYRVLLVIDAPRAEVYFSATPPPAVRVWLRLLSDALLLTAALGLAPNLRQLVLRSVLMRTGAVDRQTLTGLAAAIGVILLGDVMHAIATNLSEAPGDLLRLCGTLLIGLGSLLVTIGFALLIADAIRLAPVIVDRPLGIEDVLGPPRGASA
jgi:hypothetical protein